MFDDLGGGFVTKLKIASILDAVQSVSPGATSIEHDYCYALMKNKQAKALPPAVSRPPDFFNGL